jgi:hypothetical protein
MLAKNFEKKSNKLSQRNVADEFDGDFDFAMCHGSYFYWR